MVSLKHKKSPDGMSGLLMVLVLSLHQHKFLRLHEIQGKIERFHRSMKNEVRLQNYYLPGELEEEIRCFIDYYNNERYHESLKNVTPADVYFGRHKEIESRREKIKRRTLKQRRKFNLLPNPLQHQRPLTTTKTVS